MTFTNALMIFSVFNLSAELTNRSSCRFVETSITETDGTTGVCAVKVEVGKPMKN